MLGVELEKVFRESERGAEGESERSAELEKAATHIYALKESESSAEGERHA